MKALCLLVLVGCAAPQARSGDFRAEIRRNAPTIGEISAGSLNEAFELLQAAPPVAFFYIDSPGGSVRVGLAFVEQMSQAQAQGTVIQCVIPAGGMAASMAAVIFEQCDLRLMERGAALMFHTVSVGGAGGNQWEIERLAQDMASWNKRLAIIAAAKLNITLTEYERRVKDRDWWLGWEEAIAVGAADGVRTR